MDSKWTKVNAKRGGAGRRKRTTPGLRVGKYGTYIVLPNGMVRAKRQDLYKNGGSEIAVVFNPGGEFANWADNGSRRLTAMKVPNDVAPSLPVGTYDVEAREESGALVITFPKVEEKAEDTSAPWTAA